MKDNDAGKTTLVTLLGRFYEPTTGQILVDDTSVDGTTLRQFRVDAWRERVSATSMADMSVVLDGGRIREQGSHEELMRLGGLYAELYRLQATAYAR